MEIGPNLAQYPSLEIDVRMGVDTCALAYMVMVMMVVLVMTVVVIEPIQHLVRARYLSTCFAWVLLHLILVRIL